MKQTTRLTEGNLAQCLWAFSIPFLLANLLQALYGAADLFIVGRFSSSAAVSAVATGSQVMQTVTSAAVGLTTGGTVIIGRAFGARAVHEIADAVCAIFGVFGLLSAVLTVAVGFGLEPICNLMHTPVEAYADTREYLFICSLGIVFIVGYNAVSAILRGLGDSHSPLIFVFVACLANILGDFYFVGVLGLGAAGAAVATVGAQAISLSFAFLYLRYHGLVRRFRRSHAPFRAHTAAKLLQIGLPIAAQDTLVNLSFLLITAIVNVLGVTASAAVGITEKLIILSMLPTTAFASAVATITAQNRGAGLGYRAEKGLKLAIGLSLVPAAVFLISAQGYGENLIRLFTDDFAVIKAGAAYLQAYSWDCLFVCFVFCFNSYFAGCGKALFPLAHSLLATFAVRVPLSYLLCRAAHPSLFAVGCAAPTATLLSLLLCIWYKFHLDGHTENRRYHRPKQEKGRDKC